MEKEGQARKGDTVRNFFGFDDAADEKDLKNLFFETSEFQDVKTGDVIEAYTTEEVAPTSL